MSWRRRLRWAKVIAVLLFLLLPAIVSFLHSQFVEFGAGRVVAVVGLFTVLLADEDKTLDDFTPTHPLNPSHYAIPTAQWTALITAITGCAAQWPPSAINHCFERVSRGACDLGDNCSRLPE